MQKSVSNVSADANKPRLSVVVKKDKQSELELAQVKNPKASFGGDAKLEYADSSEDSKSEKGGTAKNNKNQPLNHFSDEKKHKAGPALISEPELNFHVSNIDNEEHR